MTDYLNNNGNLQEKDMNAEFRQAEEAFRTQAGQLWERNREAIGTIRGDLDLEPHERQDQYLQRYTNQIAPKFEQLAGEFVGRIMHQRSQDEALLSQGTSERFADHVVELSGKSTEELEQIAKTAARTGQKDLHRAAAQVGLDRNAFGLYQSWATSEPDLAAALERLRSTPDAEQLRTRTLAMKPPTADPDRLEPTYAEHQAAQERESQARSAATARRRSFFGITRQSGRHSTRI
jgi:hypothetical protein